MEFEAKGKLFKKLPLIFDKESPMNVLAHIKIEALRGKGLRITSTNLDVGCSVLISEDVEVRKEGVACVNAQKLLSLLPQLDEVYVRKFRSGFHVIHQNGKYFIPGVPVEDFPRIDEVPEEDAFRGSCPAGVLKGALARVLPYASRKEKSPLVGSVGFLFSDRYAQFFATDAFSIATVRTPKKVFDSRGGGFALPRDSVRALVGFLELATEDEQVFIESDGSLTCFTLKEHRFYARCFDFFQNFSLLLETIKEIDETLDDATSFLIETQRLLWALKSLKKLIRFAFVSIDDNKLTLEGKTSNNETRLRLPVKELIQKSSSRILYNLELFHLDRLEHDVLRCYLVPEEELPFSPFIVEEVTSELATRLYHLPCILVEEEQE